VPDLVTREGAQQLMAEKEWRYVCEVAARKTSVEELFVKGEDSEDGSSYIVKEFQTRVGDNLASETLNELQRLVWLTRYLYFDSPYK